MYKNIHEANDFFASLLAQSIPDHVETVICAPYLCLPSLAEKAQGTQVGIGAQNVHWEKEGAYTGEISIPMLQAIGVKYVIIGHSERRAYFAETDETVNKKAKAAIESGIIPIICVGETLDEWEGNQTKQVVENQVKHALQGLTPEQVKQSIIAYEPVWAIGTGKASTAEDAGEVISFIRRTIAALLNSQVADEVRIQYGGSVKPENIASFLAHPDIDGALVGGASLKPDSFLKLVQAASK
ncbi:triose-phosphate isomerase [Thermoflavimicrobium daqui]|jgi:triosephosphate isomerase|uniref:Triosephosphate isomerase n=2 Tax=Thermoflavimicrobium daqui TaxID=2137476 RepID=A0A364K5R0_9BACL|nr:triose-phosphate isomerase [Thermoflavimicrobium daqui]